MIDLDLLANEIGLEIYDTEIIKENKNTIFRIFITKNGGVNLDDCEKFSKILSPIFDVEPPVNGEYSLEISSPGLERNLSKISHFLKSIDENVKITLHDKTKFDTKILKVNGEDIEFLIDGEKKVINFKDIKKARTFF